MECCEESPQKIKKPDTNLTCIICGKSLDKASEGNVICPTTQRINTLSVQLRNEMMRSMIGFFLISETLRSVALRLHFSITVVRPVVST